jgi:hypothetical protein
LGEGCLLIAVSPPPPNVSGLSRSWDRPSRDTCSPIAPSPRRCPVLCPSERLDVLFSRRLVVRFFRHLEWSPDGNWLAVPGGISPDLVAAAAAASGKKHTDLNVVHVFHRLDLTEPVMRLHTGTEPALSVRFCPVVFRGRPSPPCQWVDPTTPEAPAPEYRMVLAVATSRGWVRRPWEAGSVVCGRWVGQAEKE